MMGGTIAYVLSPITKCHGCWSGCVCGRASGVCGCRCVGGYEWVGCGGGGTSTDVEDAG